MPKKFSTKSFGDKSDFSGFDRSLWPSRRLESHRYHAFKHKNAQNRSQEISIERNEGCRFSVLLQLPYFDPIRMCIIDPMHNLLLGTSKRMMEVWSSMKLIESKQLLDIQCIVDSFVTPSDVGRIPSKIASGFSGFTVEQWRNWTILYSLPALKGILPRDHFNCWHYFVKACHLLCRREITYDQLQIADELLNSFGLTFEKVCGKLYCTINMQLHGHLAECIKDYGPVYSFWLFAFERLNGILESFHTNSHNIPPQIMRKFLSIHRNGTLQWPVEFHQEFVPLLERHRFSRGSLSHNSLETEMEDLGPFRPLPPLIEIALDNDDIAITGFTAGEISIFPLIRKCAAIRIKEYTLGSCRSRYSVTSVVLVSPLVQSSATSPSDYTLAEIQYFFWCDVSSSSHDVAKPYCFVAVNYYMQHPARVWFGSPTQVWSAVVHTETKFLPITCIKSRVSYSVQRYDFGQLIGVDKVIIATP